MQTGGTSKQNPNPKQQAINQFALDINVLLSITRRKPAIWGCPHVPWVLWTCSSASLNFEPAVGVDTHGRSRSSWNDSCLYWKSKVESYTTCLSTVRTLTLLCYSWVGRFGKFFLVSNHSEQKSPTFLNRSTTFWVPSHMKGPQL